MKESITPGRLALGYGPDSSSEHAPGKINRDCLDLLSSIRRVAEELVRCQEGFRHNGGTKLAREQQVRPELLAGGIRLAQQQIGVILIEQAGIRFGGRQDSLSGA